MLYGNVDDTRQQNPQSAQLLAQRYAGSLDEAGAIHVAHEFANDIIQKFGGAGILAGQPDLLSFQTYPASGADEILAMDWDGSNQTQLTKLRSLSIMPAVSPDGSRIAFTSYAKGTPRIMMVDTLTGRALPFYNQEASLNATRQFHARMESKFTTLPRPAALLKFTSPRSMGRASAVFPTAMPSKWSRR